MPANDTKPASASPSERVRAGELFDSGIYERPTFPCAEELAVGLAEDLPGSTVAVLFAASVDRPARAAVFPHSEESDELAFSVPLRLDAWLTGVERPRVLEVPDFVAPWLGVGAGERALVWPLIARGARAGVVVIAPFDGLASIRALSQQIA